MSKQDDTRIFQAAAEACGYLNCLRNYFNKKKKRAAKEERGIPEGGEGFFRDSNEAAGHLFLGERDKRLPLHLCQPRKCVSYSVSRKIVSVMDRVTNKICMGSGSGFCRCESQPLLPLHIQTALVVYIVSLGYTMRRLEFQVLFFTHNDRTTLDRYDAF